MLCGCSVLCDNPCTPAITACNAVRNRRLCRSPKASSLAPHETPQSSSGTLHSPPPRCPSHPATRHSAPRASRSAPLAPASSPPPANPPKPIRTCCRPAPASATGDTAPTPASVALPAIVQTPPASPASRFSTTVTFSGALAGTVAAAVFSARTHPGSCPPSRTFALKSGFAATRRAGFGRNCANAAEAESDCA